MTAGTVKTSLELALTTGHEAQHHRDYMAMGDDNARSSRKHATGELDAYYVYNLEMSAHTTQSKIYQEMFKKYGQEYMNQSTEASAMINEYYKDNTLSQYIGSYKYQYTKDDEKSLRSSEYYEKNKNTQWSNPWQ